VRSRKVSAGSACGGMVVATIRVERRLAAILAADVVGYSRLTERDEAGTFARLMRLRRELVEPVLERHGGHFVDLNADSDDVGRAFRTEVGHLFRPKSAGRSDRCRPGWRVARRSVVISPWRCRSGQAAMAWAAFLRRESPRS
jgi:class 3 adenylate cyclase